MATLSAQLADEHARQAAFLWLLRDRAVRHPAYDLDDLCDLDGRIDAHLDGLRVAGQAGWTACLELLREAEGGEVFGAAVIAIAGGDMKGLAGVLDIGAEAPDLARGLASALGWAPVDRVKKLLPGLLSRRVSPPLTWLGVTACAAHRHDPGAALGAAILSKHARVRARALRAAGELGRRDLLPEIRDALRSDDEACRFWGAWSGALLGDDTAPGVLCDFAGRPGPFAEQAASMAVRRMAPSRAEGWVRSLAEGSPDLRPALAAAGALGDPALVPWLISAMQAPATARLATASWALITGVDLAAEKLVTSPPDDVAEGPADDPEDEDVSVHPDEGLPWPDAPAIAATWQHRGAALERGVRHLLGHPMTPAWLSHVLRRGHQPARSAAALELSLRAPGRVLFEVRAPGLVQRAALSGEA